MILIIILLALAMVLICIAIWGSNSVEAMKIETCSKHNYTGTQYYPDCIKKNKNAELYEWCERRIKAALPELESLDIEQNSVAAGFIQALRSVQLEVSK